MTLRGLLERIIPSRHPDDAATLAEAHLWASELAIKSQELDTKIERLWKEVSHGSGQHG